MLMAFLLKKFYQKHFLEKSVSKNALFRKKYWQKHFLLKKFYQKHFLEKALFRKSISVFINKILIYDRMVLICY